MKFGACRRRTTPSAASPSTRIRQDDLVLKKGTLIGDGGGGGAASAPASREIVVARLEPGDVVARTRRRPSIAARDRGRGRRRVERAFTGRANLFAAEPGVLVVDRDAVDAHQPRRRGDHPRDAAGLQAGGRGRDDRHGEDHSVRRRRASCATRPSPPARRDAAERRAVSHRSKVGIVSTLLPGLATKVVEKTLQVHRRAPCAGRRDHHRRDARRRTIRRPCSRAIDELLGKPAPSSCIVFGASAIADRRDVIPAAIEARRRHGRAFRHAGRSRQSDADRPASAARRCSARRAARARPRRTASTGS